MKRQNRVAFFNILSTVLLRGISIFTAPVFTRLLGTGGYGVTKIYNTWVSVIAIVFTLQTQGTLASARVEYPDDLQKKYQSSAMSLSLLLFLLCSAVVLIFLEPISLRLKLTDTLIVLMLVQAFGTFCVNFMNTKNVYELKAGRNMALSLGVALMTLVLSLVFVLNLPKEINYYGRIAAIAGTYALIGFPMCAVILWQGRTFFDKKYWKFCIALAVPAVFYNLSDLVLGQSDTVMLQQMLGESKLGVYSAALSFGGIMFTIFAALDNSWRPFFFDDMKQGEWEQVHEKARNYLELFTVLSVGFILLAKEIYQIYVKEEFWGSMLLIPVFVTNYYLNFLCTFPVNYEYYRKKTKAVAVVTVTSCVVNIGLNYILINRIGMGGAAVATMLSHCLQLFMHYVYVRFLLGKEDYPFPLSLWLKYALCYGMMVVFVVLTQEAGLLRWAVGAALGIWELYRVKKRKVLI